MILNITFTHPEKIYKGNKTVTNSEGNVVRLSRQKWMNVCWWRNALQSCCWRAGGSPPASGTALSGVSCLSPWCPRPLFFQPDWVQLTWHGCPGWQKYKRSPRLLLCGTSALTEWLHPDGLLFVALGTRSVAGNFKKRIMIRLEVPLPNLSSTLNCYCSFNR